MRSRFVTRLLVVLFGFGLLIGAALQLPIPISAQDTSLPEGYDARVTKEDFDTYRAATADCSTPSLECLVRNVSRFTAIEWMFDILGKGNKLCIESGSGCDVGTGADAGSSGAIGSLAGLITSMYAHPVANTHTYVADVMNSAHIVPPAYAQGLGFASLDPILNLWKTFRNIAYMFFVVIFVVVGFLIMFRQRVGQAAITAQQAIPQIIMSLLLVTFSYAIAAFLIDLMYTLMVLIVGVFSSFFPDNQDIFGYNILQLAGTLFKETLDADRNSDFISSFLSAMNIEGAANQIVSFLSGLTLSLVLTIAMFIGIVRLFFEMLRAYATIVLSVVMAPILLMFGAIPGRSNAFGTWLKTLIGHLSPFPVVLVTLVMYYAFTQGAVDTGSGGFMPPFLLSAGNSIGDSIIALMSLAILLALPDIVKHIRESISPKNAFAQLISSKGMENLKAGWSGEGLRGFGAKRGLSVIGKQPLAVAGAAGGLYAGNRYAREAGLMGKEKTAARVGGALIGGGLGYNALRAGRGLGRGAFSQLRDTVVKIQTDKFKTSLLGGMDTQHSEGETSVADQNVQQRNTVPSQGGQPQAPRGGSPSQSRRSGLS